MNESSSEGVLGQSIAAGKWSLVNTIAQRVLVFGTFFILARLLVPADFGVIALIAIVPSFLDGITAFAFDTAAVQKRGSIARYLNVIWTFNILRGTLIFVLMFLAAPFVATFFNVVEALPLLYLAGLGIFIQGFVNIGQTYFFVNFDFKKVFIRDMVLKVSYTVLTIGLAYSFHSYWALFFGSIGSLIALVLATYVLHPYRPRLDFQFGKLKELLFFSQWVLGQEMLNQTVRTVEDTLIGKFAGTTGLGLFGKAKALASAPTSPIVSLINKVSFTSYARLQDSLGQVTEGTNKTMDIMLALAVPYLIAVIITGDRIVLLLLGAGWVSLAPYLKILVVGATFDMLFVTLNASLFNALGKVRVQFVISSLYATSILIGFFILVPLYGILGAAIATTTSLMLTSFVALYYQWSLLKMNFSQYGTTFLATLTACVAPVLMGQTLLDLPFFNSNLGYCILMFFAGILYLAGLYIIHLVFKRGPYSTLQLIAYSFLKK